MDTLHSMDEDRTEHIRDDAIVGTAPRPLDPPDTDTEAFEPVSPDDSTERLRRLPRRPSEHLITSFGHVPTKSPHVDRYVPPPGEPPQRVVLQTWLSLLIALACFSVTFASCVVIVVAIRWG